MEQTVATPARAKVLTLDTKTNQILTITAEFGPVPAAPAQGAARHPLLAVRPLALRPGCAALARP